MNRRPLLPSAAILVTRLAAISAVVAAACSPSAKQEGAQLAAQAVDATPVPKPIDANAPAAPAGASLAQAKPVSVGAPGATEIGNIDSMSNFYRIDNGLKVRDVVIVRLDNLSSTLKPSFKIYDDNRSELSWTEDGTPGASVERGLTLGPKQPFYVEVLPCLQYHGCSSGKYALRVMPQHAFDNLEPNDDGLTASPATVGRDIDANIMDDHDSDWLHFTGAPQKPLTVTLENQSTTLKPSVAIYNSNKSQLSWTEDATPGANLSFPLPPEAGTDFYVRILPCLRYQGCSTGKYKLSVK